MNIKDFTRAFANVLLAVRSSSVAQKEKLVKGRFEWSEFGKSVKFVECDDANSFYFTEYSNIRSGFSFGGLSNILKSLAAHIKAKTVLGMVIVNFF